MFTSPRFDRILFATDFLESSRLALDYAEVFAEHFRSTLIMLHVIELSQAAREAEAESHHPSVMRRLAQERLHTLAAGAERLGIKAEVHVEDGIPSDVILGAIGRHDADLLVLGVHGVHRGIEHLLIGSNTEKILLSAACPTLTVGAHVPSGVSLKAHLNKILYLSDFSPEAAAAAPYAAFLGRELHAPVKTCQLVPPEADNNPRRRAGLLQKYSERIGLMGVDQKAEWLAPTCQLQRGTEIEQMIELAQSQDAGLIVLGVRAASALSRRLHTSFAYHLLAGAPCPVLSVRPPA